MSAFESITALAISYKFLGYIKVYPSCFLYNFQSIFVLLCLASLFKRARACRRRSLPAFALNSEWTPVGLQLHSVCRHKSRALHKKLLICEIKSHLPRCNQHKHCVCTLATSPAATKRKLLLFGIRQIWMPSQAKSKCDSCSPSSLTLSIFICCIFSLSGCKSMSKSESA